MKTLRHPIWDYLTIALVSLISFGSVFGILSFRGAHYHTYSISSGSMIPTLPVGTLVFAKPEPHYAVGDIITFTLPTISGGQQVVTHRISGINGSGDQETFTTKGDANASADITAINQAAIKGKVTRSLRSIGYIETFLHTKLGMILLIAIPATILVYEHLKVAHEEITKWRRSKRMSHSENATNSSVGA
jgi:signal peptidase